MAVKPWTGALTVEQAAERGGMEAWKLAGFAALGGCPKAYGPFPSVEDSAWRIFIDEPDLAAWIAAGKPSDAGYRDGAAQTPTDQGEGQ